MKILGIDPGLALLGWSVLEAENQSPRRVHFGCIRTESHLSLTRRLVQLQKDLDSLFKRYKPDAVALETLFFQKNAKTLAQVGHSRGVILLTAGLYEIPVTEYAPRQIKLALTGYGGADKKQMQMVVQRILQLEAIPKPDDAADAVAVALCHLQYNPHQTRTAITV